MTEQAKESRGMVELSDQEMEQISGGAKTVNLWLKSNGNDVAGEAEGDIGSSRQHRECICKDQERPTER